MPTRADAELNAEGLPVQAPPLKAFRGGLAELGYVEGQNVKVLYYFTVEGDEERLPEIAAGITAMNPDVIVAIGTNEAWAVRDATDSIPIVFAAVADPVERGLAQSYSHPGGNITGVAPLSEGLTGKRLALLRELIPLDGRIAVLSTPGWDSPGAPKARQWREVQNTAKALDIDVSIVGVQDEGSAAETTETILKAIARAKAEGADGLLLLTDALFHTRRAAIAQAALELGLPTMYSLTEFAEVGGLMAYAPNSQSVFRKTAEYVDRILHGTMPGDLPIERQIDLELVFNLDTASDLGIDVPPSLQVQISRAVRRAGSVLVRER